jgi:phytoene desaturase
LNKTGKHVIVIGAGIGGLAVAIRLAARGFRVAVFESSGEPGGKIKSINRDGYRFDQGPSLFTMPELVTELLDDQSKNEFRFKKIPVACHYFYEDGTQIKGFSDPEHLQKEFEDELQIKDKSVVSYLRHSNFLHEKAGHIFLERSLHKVKSYVKRDILTAIFNIPKLDLFKTMNEANEKRLKHPKLVQYFNRFATYNGSNPYSAPGILNVIPSLEHGSGVFFPDGGMYAITQALFERCRDLNVDFHFDNHVEKIIVENGRTKGVVANDKTYPSDLVISNMDVYPTYRKLLKEQAQPEKILNQERSSSAVVFYWGIKKTFPKLGLHNIFFSKDYRKEFDDIFRKKVVHTDPTVYINISSRENSDDAPEGCENWFVMVNAPYNEGQNWTEIVRETKKSILKKLSRHMGVEIEELIQTEMTWDPVKIENDTHSYKGSIYGTSSNSRLAAFFRHPNFSNSIKNLFFVGGSVHPGGGIPLALNSAKIVDQLIK